MISITGAVNLLRSIMSHPLNRRNRRAALGRFIRWQIATRALPCAVAIPFVNGTRLLATRSMAGAASTIYYGLHEFADMAFLLHALRPGNQFLDIGANIGTYAVLAGSVGARTIAFEPVPAAFKTLVENITLNQLADRIEARNVAVGARRGTALMTNHLDTEGRLESLADHRADA